MVTIDSNWLERAERSPTTREAVGLGVVRSWDAQEIEVEKGMGTWMALVSPPPPPPSFCLKCDVKLVT